MLKRKFCKHKQIFDETLLGLYLSRMSIMEILFSLGLKAEEIIYIESRDILEHVIDAPSRNPVFFINALSLYFGLDFKPDFLRMCRSDKFLLLSKSQPITANDIQNVNLIPRQYFSIRE